MNEVFAGGVEWGVADPGWAEGAAIIPREHVRWCQDEDEARRLQQTAGGELVRRPVYVTEWGR